MAEKGQPLPKFGDWDVNDPASAEGFTMIFNKARNEKKTGGKPDSPAKVDSTFKHGADLGKPQPCHGADIMPEYWRKEACVQLTVSIKNGFAACNQPMLNPEAGCVQ